MDIVGVLRGWKFFDHAGHLGGVLFAVYVYLALSPGHSQFFNVTHWSIGSGLVGGRGYIHRLLL